ncbi:Lipocalin-like domain-containing protein [Cladophialophora immunda]|nr:Lipocalin-like domain-containing protein [Cladophialophora immunda]
MPSEASRKIRSQLTGSWELIEYSLPLAADPSSKLYPMTAHVRGMILYTEDGYMSAQLHIPGQKPFDGEQPFDRAVSAEEAAAAQAEWANVGRNYVAYTGEFYIDVDSDEQPVIKHHMRCASLPYMVTDVQERTFQFEDRSDGNRYLVLGLPQPIEVRGEDRNVFVLWRRLPFNERSAPDVARKW